MISARGRTLIVPKSFVSTNCVFYAKKIPSQLKQIICTYLEIKTSKLPPGNGVMIGKKLLINNSQISGQKL